MKYYSNLKKKNRDFLCADPFVIRWLGSYYMFCTSDYCKIYRSENLLDWEYVGTAIEPDPENKDILGCYAPEVTYFGGKFYLCYSPKGNEHRFFVSDRIDGGYKLLTPDHALGIDGSWYIGDNNVTLFRSAGVNGAQKDGIYFKTAPSPLELADRGEWTRVEGAYLDGWTEGPMAIDKGNWRYLTITGNHYLSKAYRIAYCSQKIGEPIENIEFQDNLLISTSKRFYGLGHSSTLTAPDLNGKILAFHNAIFKKKGKRKCIRFCNFTALTFDGKAMFANGTSDYKTPAFIPPFAQGYDLQGLSEKKYGYSLPLPDKTFTAEICLNLNADDKVYIGDWVMQVKDNMCSLEKGEDRLEKEIIPVTTDNPYCFTVENGKKCTVTLNGQRLFVVDKVSADILIPKSANIEYWATSRHADDSSQKALIKNIPSVFPASACVNNVKSEEFNGRNYVIANKLIYHANVSKKGDYLVTINAKCEKGKYCVIKFKDKLYSFTLPNADGKIALGTVRLPKGLIEITVDGDLKLCDIGFIKTEKYKKGFTDYKYEKCILTLSNASYHNFSASFNYAMADEYNGGIVLRASEHGYYPNQQNESFLGYLVALYGGKLHFYKCMFNKKELATFNVDAPSGTITITAQGNLFSFDVNGKKVAEISDDSYHYGKLGIIENPPITINRISQ